MATTMRAGDVRVCARKAILVSRTSMCKGQRGRGRERGRRGKKSFSSHPSPPRPLTPSFSIRWSRISAKNVSPNLLALAAPTP